MNWYSPGVNAIFFDTKDGRAAVWTDKLWVYDLRTNQHFTLKQKPIQRGEFDEFIDCHTQVIAWVKRIFLRRTR